MDSKDLSSNVTHFKYYTKRINKYFFTAWINGEYGHIKLKLNSYGSEIEFVCCNPTEEQHELILNACFDELKRRKLLL